MDERRSRNALKKTLAGIFPDQYENITKKKVYIINGAPGSGKTTYVQTHKTGRDLVVDLDYLCAALNATSDLYQDHEPVLAVALQLQNLLYQIIEDLDGKWETAWVVTAAADWKKVKDLAHRLDAEIISIDTPQDQCIRNIQSDNRRSGSKDMMVKLTEKWFAEKKSF